MQSFEYRVVPAPRRPAKIRGARKPQDRFALTVEGEMNRLAQEGWEYVRSDTLPCEQKPGWFSRSVTVFETMLVFRRPMAQASGANHAAATMPPPVSLTPPAFIAAPTVAGDASATPPVAPPSRAVPAASRFTPLPAAARAANLTEPAVVPVAAPPPGPTLSLVEPGAEVPNPRRAAE